MRAVVGQLSLVGVLLLTGCSQTVDGHPGPSQTGMDTYGVDLSEEEQANLRASALIRTIDPCGYFDLDALARFGRVVQLGPDSNLNECQAGVLTSEPPADRPWEIPYPAQVSLALDTTLTNPGTPTTLNGVTVIQGKDTQRCDYSVEFPLPGDGRPERITILTSGFGGEDDRDGLDPANCAAGMTVVESISRAGKLPLRSDSSMKVPLAEVDPCSILAHLPPGWSVPDGGWKPRVSAYGCEFRLQNSDTSEKDYVTMIFDIDQDGLPTPASAPSNETCNTRFPVGQTIDGNLPDNRMGAHLQSFVRVKVAVDILSDCDNHPALARAARTLFGG